METIKIKCPNCGAILTVPDNPANQKKTVTCPICKLSNPFMHFKRVVKRISEEEDKTDLGVNLNSDDKTCLPDFTKEETVGCLRDNASGMSYKLSFGINLIGRMTYQSAPAASVPVKTEDRGFSRKHLKIEVIRDSVRGIKYYAYNAENKNPTYINGAQLNNNDRVVLHNGDIIKSSSTELVLKID